MYKNEPVTNRPTITQAFLEEILLRYDIKSFTYEFPKSGKANTTLLIHATTKNVVLRIYRRNNRSVEDINTELAFMRDLSAINIPTPIVVPNSDGHQIGQIKVGSLGWNYILMEFAPGSHASDYSFPLLKNLAQVQARMHTAGKEFTTDQRETTNTPHVLRDIFVPKIDRSEMDNLAVLEFLEHAHAYTVDLPSNLPCGYNHLDFDADNVLVEDNTVTAVLDFDDLALTPMVVCLGNTLWDILNKTGDIAKVRTYLYSYNAKRPFEPVELDWIQPVMMFRNYAIGSVDVLFHGVRSGRIDRCLELERVISAISKDTLAWE